ncbi:hypothetical protein QYE76_014627 [Lolium multiflorum]|uniref:Aminotransferase-like plant mobile domain-containing protein n=1 Tax=Lolium multiflorum TaxID=4521 RepID=A0AAD8U115_LOLMU|nr:hypothetical protein QYE76_014627 [Lolium multiflorum]
MNAAALTALVDRWRPETHTFHLRAGEMAPTLQDVSMILGLPIQAIHVQYTAELDTLTAEQVEWESYGSYYRIGAGMAD